MASKKISYQWMVIVFSLIASTMARGDDASEAFMNAGSNTISIEYLSPTKDDRDIETINMDFNSLISRLDELNLSIYFSITGTYVTGNITQLEGDINAGTLREVRFDNSAFGIGPGLLMSFRLIAIDKLSFHLNGSGNFIIYNERFPAGGDYYNFMWRGGSMVEYKLGDSTSIGLSYQRSHVSNGQGVSPDNPSYSAHGFALRFTGLF